MAAVLGVNCVIKFNSVDWSAYCTEVDKTRTANVKNTSTFGVMNETFVEAQNNTKVTFKFLFDKAASTPDVGLDGAFTNGAKVLDYYPESSGAGASNIKYSGNAIVTSHKLMSKYDDLVSGDGAFQVSGVMTRSTVA